MDGVKKHVDLNCPKVSGKYNEVYYSRDLFLSELEQQLRGDTNRKYYTARVDLYLTACSEEFNTYISTIVPGDSPSQNTEVYSNIKGGIGMFASRRTHLFKRMPCDDSDLEGRGLYYFIDSLDLGFYK